MINKNPNLVLKETITKEQKFRGCKFIGNLGFNDLFEIYYPLNEKYKKRIFLAKKGEDNNSNIDIIDIENKELINQLKNGHENNKTISMIRYFCNIQTREEYLISSNNREVIVWELNTFYIFHKINSNYPEVCYSKSSMILFNDNNKSYPNLLIISYSGKQNNFNFISIYNFERMILLKAINGQESSECFYLLKWDKYEKKEYKKTYIIACCDKQIIIYNINKDNEELIYSRLKDEKEKFVNYFSACLVNNNDNDYLYASSGVGAIYVWDLNKKHLINYIRCKNSDEFYGIVDYNEKYLVTGDISGNLFVIDININKIIYKIVTRKCFGVISFKKVMHPIYGLSILTCGRDDSIKLWSTFK